LPSPQGSRRLHDYHIHCHFCRHAAGRIVEYARAARDKGLGEICLTPHIPLPDYRPGFYGNRLRMDPDEFPRYLEELEEARCLVPGITILSGVEADYVEGTEEYLERFLASYPFDLVLMSVHFVRAWPGNQWVFDLSADRRPLERIYDDYLGAVRAGVETGLFDCIAHLDLIKQEGHPLLDTHRREIGGLIRLCRDRGMSAEVNMSGARKAIGEPYPAWPIVQLMVNEGLALVPGSDAHEPSQVAAGLEALEGITLVRYRGRRILEAGARPASPGTDQMASSGADRRASPGA
jgi:histidinol-phosphatase (PHP family)